jgi:TP901 family phage tail tape measure protein
MTPDLQRLIQTSGSWNVTSKQLDKQIAKEAATLRRLRPELAFIAEDQEVLRQAMRRLPVERLERLGHAMSGLGRTAQLFGAIGTVSFGLASAAAADFASKVSLAATQMRDVVVQTPTQAFNQIEQRTDQLANGFIQAGVPIQGVLDLMGEYPASSDDMTAAAYDIFSSMNLQKNGIIDVAAGMGLLETANQIAVAGQVDLSEATSAMITVLNNFREPGQTTNDILDTMFDIVRFGRMRLSDFNVMMNKIAPAAAGAGLSLEDVGGAMAFLTQVMPSQRMVATGISRLIEAFRHPDIVAGLKATGIAALDAEDNLRPLDELLLEIKTKLNPKDAAEFFRIISAAGRGGGRGMMFTAEGRRAFNQIMKHTKDYLAAQKQIEKNTGEFGVSLATQLNSMGVKWNIFKNQLRALVIVIGNEAIPVFTQLGEYIQNFVTWFKNLDPELRGSIIRMLAWAAVGTLIGGVLLSLMGSITSFLAALRLITMTGGGVATTLTTLLSLFKMMAAFGAIAIMLKVAWAGEATAIDFLLGAAFGAAAGSIFGPAGAVLGAVTVPVILSLIADKRKSGMEKAYDQYNKEFEDKLGGTMNFFKDLAIGPKGIFGAIQPIQPEFDKKNFEEQWNTLAAAAVRAQKKMYKVGKPEGLLKPGNLDLLHRKAVKFGDAMASVRSISIGTSTGEVLISTVIDGKVVTDKQAIAHYKKTGENLGTFTSIAAANAYADTLHKQQETMGNSWKKFQERLAKVDPGIRDLFKKFGPKPKQGQSIKDYFDKLRAGADGLSDSAKENMQAWEDWYTAVNAAQENAIDRQKELAKVTEDTTNQTVNALKSMYMQMEQVNQEAFGQLFKGPWLTSETFDLAKEWGIMPGINDLIIDLKEQNALFARWRSSLDKLIGKGLPKGFIDELQKMGPEEGQSIIDAILGANPKKVNQLISEWKKKNNQIKTATKMDFKSEIQAFQKAGGDMGDAMIEGFEAAGVGLWFDDWVTKTFPNIINAAVDQAVADWKAANPKTVIPPQPPPINPKNTSATTNNDNSKTITVNMGRGGSQWESQQAAEEVRRAAFAARNALKSLL